MRQWQRGGKTYYYCHLVCCEVINLSIYEPLCEFSARSFTFKRESHGSLKQMTERHELYWFLLHSQRQGNQELFFWENYKLIRGIQPSWVLILHVGDKVGRNYIHYYTNWVTHLQVMFMHYLFPFLSSSSNPHAYFSEWQATYFKVTMSLFYFYITLTFQ